MKVEIEEIKELIPQLNLAIQQAKTSVVELAKSIETEVLGQDQLFNNVIPKLNAAITENQYEKDRLATEMTRQRRYKERLAEDVVKYVVESN
jgi:hypothetical protein